MNTTTKNETMPVNKELIAGEYEKMMLGKLDAAKIKAAKNTIMTSVTGYPAIGSIASVLFWFPMKCNVTNGKSYSGNAWGAGTPGGGWLGGTVYTDDIDLLYSNTTSATFLAVAIPVGYTTFFFHDDDGNLLGTFQSASVSTVIGTGSGSGSWE